MKIIMRLSATAVFAVLTLNGSARAQLPESFFSDLKPRAIGPAVFGGRVTAFAVYEADPAIFYAGSASGGLLKTVNGGNTWEYVFDRQGSASIGDVAINPNDPNVVWVGTGEANQRQSVPWGDGIYKSIDGGKTWRHMGLQETHHIGRIVVSPQDPNIVYVAALGHLWGPNPERGLFMTTDGGITWQKTLAIDDDTGVNDVIMDPTDPTVLYAAAYQRRRSSWGINGGGPGSAIYKSVDAGRTWRKLTNGIPAGDKGRIGFDVSRKTSAIFAIIEHRDGGIFRSDDKGESWTRVSNFNHARPGYYSKINVDPSDERRVYVLGEDLHVSDDGGKTFRNDGARETTVHQKLWIDPRNSRHMILGSGSGIWITQDRGRSWDHLNNYTVGQFYHLSVDMQQPYWIYGGTRDNSTWGGPSAVRDRVGIRNQDWVQMQGRDGLYTVVDPTDPNTVYTESQYGGIIRYDKKTGERKAIMPQPAPGEPRLRWNWTTPIVISPNAPKTIYIGAQKVFKSTDRGQTWTAISPDLTTQTDRDTLKLMGVRGGDIAFTRYHGVVWFTTITALVESPKLAGLMYAGTDDGNVQMTKDGGRSWINLTSRIPGVPKMLVVSSLTPSAVDAGTVYLTFDGHLSDDYKPYAYVSSDYGQTWRSIAANLPSGSVNTITEDPKNSNLLYLGTETGLFVSTDRGANWTRWTTMPTVPVREIIVHPRDNDLVLGTHGRSILVIDDIAPIQQLNPTVLASNSHLFDIRPATQFIPNESGWMVGGRDFAAPNPEFGAYVNYYLKSPAPEPVKITISNAAGSVVRQLTGPPQAGIHRVLWDLRTAPVGPATFGGIYGNPIYTNLGPFVLPGVYSVKLAAAGQEQTKTVRVLGDPLVTISDVDRKRVFDVLTTASAMQSTAASAADAINQLNQQLRQVMELLKTSSNASPSVKTTVDNTANQVGDLRVSLIGGANPSGTARVGSGGVGSGGVGDYGYAGERAPPEPLRDRIRTLKTELIGSQSLPTAIQSAQLENYRKELNDLVAKINATITTAIPALNKQLADNNIRPSLGEPIKPVKPVAR
jgi:photosystem II stability/assembly factor-like uncharacterized protein